MMLTPWQLHCNKIITIISSLLVVLTCAQDPSLINTITESLLGVQSRGDIYNAQVELEALFQLRTLVSQAVEEYLSNEQTRLSLVRETFLASSGLSLNEGSSGNENYNPINAFITIKGLSSDLSEVLKHSLDRSNSETLAATLESLGESRKFPDLKDVKGAAVALTRLQETYLLSTESIGRGCLGQGFCSGTELSVDDCFEIGKQSYDDRSYDTAILWFNEALRKLNSTSTSRESFNSTQAGIQDYLRWAQDIKNTLRLGKQFLNELTGMELDAFVDEIVKATEERNQGTTGDNTESRYSIVLKNYEALCRGEQHREGLGPNLNCSLLAPSSYFTLSPVKTETLSLDPLVLLFHDVIYDGEIEIIKRIAQPMFKTATVVDSSTGGTQQSTVRVSKSSWLIDDDDPVVAGVNRRIEALTNLNMQKAEDLQIANYGLGGMYLPHLDFSHTPETIRWLPADEGNRIATLMFYLTDVEAGGATAFPQLNLTVWPEKGAALFWWNLKPDGRGDFRTQHGACPVLIGSKWVANKWFHERGQEFIRPCDLHHYEAVALTPPPSEDQWDDNDNDIVFETIL